MNDDLIMKIKYLRLSGLAANLDRYLKKATEKNFSHIRFLKSIIEEEYEIKIENSKKLRIHRAKIPEKWIIESFPFNRQPHLNKKKIINIYDNFDYMTHTQNIIFLGPTGVGKTGLATAFLIQAIHRGYNGRFIHFPELIENLYRSKADHSEEKVMKTFVSFDCLLIDELGYVEVDPVQVGLFFKLMSKRHKNKTTLITTNLGFEKWPKFLKNDHITAALIDRLTETSHVINMRKCVSLRAKLNSHSD